MLSVILFFVVAVAASTVEPYYKHAEISPEYQLPCMAVGGKCMLNEECPKSRQVQMKGLCPIKAEDGLECCYSERAIPKRTTRSTCQSRGGECMPSTYKCPDFLLFSSAIDCNEDEHCCILIK